MAFRKLHTEYYKQKNYAIKIKNHRYGINFQGRGKQSNVDSK